MSRPHPAPLADFIGLPPGAAHFAGGGQTPLPRAALDAFTDFAAAKADGQRGYELHWQIADAARTRVAALTSGQPADVAFLGSASDAIDRVLGGIDWRAGDNAVMPALDYDSGRVALQKLAARGVALHAVPAEDWLCDEAAVIAACDGRTRAVYLSQVNALTGQRLDVARIFAALKGRGIILINDASHALGALPVDARAASVTVASCYKFLHAGFMAVLIANPDNAPPPPPGGGWRSEGRGGAAAFEYGNAPHLGVAVLGRVLDYLAGYDADDRAAHLLARAGEIRALCVARGLGPMTPEAPARRGQNICLPLAAAPHLPDALEARGIRLWCDRGRIRFSAQIFTDETAIAALGRALAEA